MLQKSKAGPRKVASMAAPCPRGARIRSNELASSSEPASLPPFPSGSVLQAGTRGPDRCRLVKQRSLQVSSVLFWDRGEGDWGGWSWGRSAGSWSSGTRLSTRASHSLADTWQSTEYNEKCSRFMTELSEAAELRQWDRARGLLLKASKDIDSYLNEDDEAVGSHTSFSRYSVRDSSKVEDLLRDVETMNLPKPLLVMFARRLIVGKGQGKGAPGKRQMDAHLMHSLQILRWLRTCSISKQAEMVSGLKDYTKIVNRLLRKSKSFKAKVNPYKQRAYEIWLDMKKLYAGKMDAAAVRSGMNACAMTMRTGEALDVFEAWQASPCCQEEPEVDLSVCFNILIKGFGFERNLKKLEEVVSKMSQQGVVSTQSTYNALVSAYVNSNRVDMAWRVLQEAMQPKGGAQEDEESKQYMYATILKGLVMNVNPELTGLQQAVDLMNQMKTQGVVPDVYVYSQLIDHLIKKMNDVDAADRLFQLMQKENFGGVVPTVVVYNILLRGYCNQQSSLSRNGVGWSKARCLELLKDMGLRGIKPNTSTFNTLISAAVSNEDQRSANKLFRLMVDLKVDPDRMTYTIIMKSFSDQRRPDEVVRIFKQLDASAFGGADKIAFNCLIGAHGKAGQLEEAEEAYNQMLKRSIEPDSVTFNSMVRACCSIKEPRKAVLFVKRACAKQIRIAPALADVTVKMCIAAEEFSECKSMLKSMKQAGVEGVDIAERFVEERRVASTQKEKSVGLERAKFWIGLPNKYYDQDWKK
ncbi:hypothetical protein HOP50_18g82060 [Chloropicon primus]|nr:hypothetical protein HOP50_18g82060 [Chloropicon primus]